MKPDTILNYIGPSMNPLFRDGDGLILEPCVRDALYAGDVIVFNKPGRPRNVVHRIISIGPEGIRTRGDNNNSLDHDILQMEHLIGRVIAVKRGREDIPVTGGAGGMKIARRNWVRKRLVTVAIKLLHRPYRLMACLSSWLLCRFLKIKLLRIARPGGATELQCATRHGVIARKKAATDRWRIMRPFRLFINEKQLLALEKSVSNERRSP